MLLQGNRSAERPIQAVPTATEQDSGGPGQHRDSIPLPPIALSRQTYAPISWEHPSLGKTVATGMGGIARTSALMVGLAAVGIGVAMAVAIVIAGIVMGLGFDASTGY
ncbi:hypothetical protein GCM10010172_51890 [Paractinoplanes ferrugineus]|uniref:Uncharacterized protein n=1 Tax=Paractinoplanes ferrugineus TaxID=113564 RepID=A0A919J245_9ACTN|nr:hypothetical protein [Actinoplanes ferrugineus]GIE11992.1 hypothetical protein Afe05nite_38320 [Actinoplanes ferrugineus]